MAKPAILIAGVVGALVVIGGIVLLVGRDDTPSTNNTLNNESTETAKTELVDPEGVYDLISDPSVAEHPEAGALFGNGQTLTFVYDGSKTDNDEYATLSYQLYYIQDDGKVQPIGGGNLEGKGSGTFTTSDSVYDSNAKDRKGFFELQGTYNTGLNDQNEITGSNVTLGMYSITFDLSE